MNSDTTVDTIDVTDAKPDTGSGVSVLGENLDIIKNVELELEILLGKAEMTVKELFDLKNDAIVKLDREISAPVDIRLHGEVIARGELVAVDDNYGVRIVQISSWK